MKQKYMSQKQQISRVYWVSWGIYCLFPKESKVGSYKSTTLLQEFAVEDHCWLTETTLLFGEGQGYLRIGKILYANEDELKVENTCKSELA